MTDSGSSDAPRLFSVVIPFYNRREEVEPCLRSFLSQEIPSGWEGELIAVDNGSTDGTVEELGRFAVRVLSCTRPGPAAARNDGVAAARGEVILLADSDCVARPGWLAEMLGAFDDPEVLIAGGRIRGTRPRTGVERFAEEFGILDQEVFLHGRTGMPPFFATANMAVRRAAWEAAGGFDEELRVGEDADFCWRVMDRGGAMLYRRRAVVLHRHRHTFEGLFRWGMDYGIGTAHLLSKHRDRLGPGPHVAWGVYPPLAAAPLVIAWNFCFSPTLHGRREAIYAAVYRSGLLLGRWRGAARHRVLCF